MRKTILAGLIMSFLGLLLGPSSWESTAQTRKELDDAAIKEVIRKFTENESRLREEYKSFLFKQDIKVQTLGPRGMVTGEFRRVSEIIVNDRGQREERITYFPRSTLREISITQYDFDDFAGIQPFALGKEDLPKYIVSYVGREKIDDLYTYSFDVRPRVTPDPKKLSERYFQGRVWVDTEDLMIVKVVGKALPEDRDNKFPRFETYRENIEGKLWFPTYTEADDTLEFREGPIHVRMIISYTNYKRFGGKIEILDVEPEEAGKKKDEKPPVKKP
jgi:hypothetical protein